MLALIGVFGTPTFFDIAKRFEELFSDADVAENLKRIFSLTSRNSAAGLTVAFFYEKVVPSPPLAPQIPFAASIGHALVEHPGIRSQAPGYLQADATIPPSHKRPDSFPRPATLGDRPQRARKRGMSRRNILRSGLLHGGLTNFSWRVPAFVDEDRELKKQRTEFGQRPDCADDGRGCRILEPLLVLAKLPIIG